MRIVCISDTHGRYNFKVPDGDVLLFAGDISHNTLEDLNIRNFNKFLNKQPHKHKLIIPGNHDFFFEKYDSDVLLTSHDVYYLHQQEMIIDGVKFYGSAFQPKFYDWAFNLRRGEPLKLVWDMIPDDVDVLLTHTPPANILDLTDRGDHTGCEDLMRRIPQLKKLKLHCFGHIHPSHGMEEINGVKYVNASICNEEYEAEYEPIVIDIEGKKCDD